MIDRYREILAAALLILAAWDRMASGLLDLIEEEVANA